MKYEIENYSKYYLNDKLEIYSKRYNHLISTRVNRTGYISASLTNDQGKRHDVTLHRIVAKIFVENPDPATKNQVNHIDGDKTNYSIENLEWVSCAENIQHAYDTKLHIKASGVDSPNTRYTEFDVRFVCGLIQDGFSDNQIGKYYLMNRGTIKSIRGRKSFKDISCEYNFPPNSKVSISPATAEWIYKRILEGKTNKEIMKLTTNPFVKLTTLQRIRSKRSFKTLTDSLDQQ